MLHDKKTNLFSAPLPFSKEQIEQIAVINDKYKYNKINMLYNCLPLNSVEKSGYEQHRCWDERVASLDDLVSLVKFARSYGLEFTYLINSVNTPNVNQFRNNKDKFNSFLNKLLENDIFNLRVSNTFIAQYILENYNDFNVLGSTSQEYHSLKQYQNYFKHFNKISDVVLSWEQNKNFTLISNLRTAFPNVKIELMVNEGCLGGCPFRHDHHSSNVGFSQYKDDLATFFNYACGKISNGNKALQICLDNIIYPWQINTYNRYGIYNFKLVGRNSPYFTHGMKYIEIYDMYLKGVEFPESILEERFINFNNYLMGFKEWNSIKVKDIKPLLPDISFFEENGLMCSSVCGQQCRYCYECAENVTEFLVGNGLSNGRIR